ncbi:MAG TPA: hypothetical protein VF597_04300 [Candidatus Saccharimonadales bacterium]|jgi:hypothetical protein
MVDLMDQWNDALVRLEHKPESGVQEMTVVIFHRGRWQVEQITGRATQVNDAMERKYGERSLDLLPWARGYRGRDGAVIVHPKSNSKAEEELLKAMGLRPATNAELRHKRRR